MVFIIILFYFFALSSLFYILIFEYYINIINKTFKLQYMNNTQGNAFGDEFRNVSRVSGGLSASNSSLLDDRTRVSSTNNV